MSNLICEASLKGQLPILKRFITRFCFAQQDNLESLVEEKVNKNLDKISPKTDIKILEIDELCTLKKSLNGAKYCWM